MIGRVPITNIVLGLACVAMGIASAIDGKFVDAVLLLGMAFLLVDVYISR